MYLTVTDTWLCGNGNPHVVTDTDLWLYKTCECYTQHAGVRRQPGLHFISLQLHLNCFIRCHANGISGILSL
jgi:hypothetical protein